MLMTRYAFGEMMFASDTIAVVPAIAELALEVRLTDVDSSQHVEDCSDVPPTHE